MLCGKKFEPVTLTFDLENQQGSRLFEGLSMYQFWSKSIEGCRFQSIHKDVTEERTDGRKEGRKKDGRQCYNIPSQLRWRGDNKNVDTTFSSHDAFMEKLVKYMVFFHITSSVISRLGYQCSGLFVWPSYCHMPLITPFVFSNVFFLAYTHQCRVKTSDN